MNYSIFRLSVIRTVDSPLFSGMGMLRVVRCSYIQQIQPFFFSNNIKSVGFAQSIFRRCLKRALTINGNYSITYNNRQYFPSSLSLENCLFQNCRIENEDGGAFYAASGIIFNMTHIGFYNCCAKSYGAYYLIALSQESKYICISYGSASQCCYYIYVTNNNNPNKCSFISAEFYSIHISLKRGSSVNYSNWNVSNNNGGVGHAYFKPPYVNANYLNLINITSDNAIHPSSTNGGFIISVNFVKVKASTAVILYWQTNILVKDCVFIDCDGYLAKRSSSATQITGFSFQNCISNREFLCDLSPNLCFVTNNVQTMALMHVGTCFNRYVFENGKTFAMIKNHIPLFFIEILVYIQ